MIIQCSSCDKKFNVPDSAITAAGRLVQCSSCGNKWTQYPIKNKQKTVNPISTIAKAKPKKKVDKRKAPIPYSKEYMQQKWGSSVQNYAMQKGLTKKITSQPKTSKKTQKQKSARINERPGFGFFNYIITYSVIFIFLVGILKFERGRLGRKFPAIEPYINHFFESLEIFKIFILDFFR